METETAANPVDDSDGFVDLDAPEANPETPEQGTDDLDALAREASGETEATPEFIEVEIDGRKLKVSSVDGTPVDPELKFGALRDADYRKKTMTLAEERKAYQQEREAFQARANLTGEAAMRAQQFSALDAEIRQLSQISISSLREQGWTDEQIADAQDHLRQKAAQRSHLANQVQADIARLAEQDRAEFSKAREAAIQQASLDDKALTPERIDYLEKFATDMGVDADDAKSITDPVAYKLLHLADVGAKFLERQRNAANMRNAASGNPAKTLGGASSGSKSPEAMSFEEFAAWREAGNG